MSEWRDIATAPKDGTRILLYEALDKFVAEGVWRPPLEKWPGQWAPAVHWPFGRFGYKRAAHGSEPEFVEPQITHWQPLPEPPKPAPDTAAHLTRQAPDDLGLPSDTQGEGA